MKKQKKGHLKHPRVPVKVKRLALAPLKNQADDLSMRIAVLENERQQDRGKTALLEQRILGFRHVLMQIEDFVKRVLATK